MKKKLLFISLLVVLFACLFVLSASAETITYRGEEIPYVNDLGDPSWYTGNTALAIQDKESIVILKDANGNKTAYPSYYILKFGVDMKDGVPSNVYVLWADQNGVDYSFVNEKAGKSYESGSIYYIEFPYGMTKCMGNSIFGKDADSKPESNFVEIVIPDSVTVIDSQAFRRMNSCEKVTISKNLKEIPSWAFCGSTKLTTVVFPEGSVLETTGNSFGGCTSLSSINIENCKNLRVLGSGVFDSCTSLHYINLPDSIQSIGDKAFYKNGQLELASDYLPKNLTYIGTKDNWGNENGHFLSGCTLVNDVLYFPEGFTSLTSQYNFNDGFTTSDNDGLALVFLGKVETLNLSNLYLADVQGEVKLVFAKNSFDELNGDFLQSVLYGDKHAYISKHADGSAPYTLKTEGTLTVNLCNNNPNTSTKLGTDENGNTIYQAQGAPASLIFCGSDTVEFCYSVRNNYTDKGWYRFFTTEWTYDMQAHEASNVHYSSKVYQERNCGYDECTTYTCVICDLVSIVTGEKATGEHIYTDDFNCETATICDICKLTLVEALVHDIQASIAYENGYIAQGEKTMACSHNGCNHVETVKTDAIFVFLGYSTKESSTEKGITFGYNINLDALAMFEEINGNLEFGTVLAFKAKLGDNEPIVNGDVASIENCNIIMPKLRDTVVNGTIYSIDFVLKGTVSLWEADASALGADILQNVPIILAGYTIDAKGNTTYFASTSSQTSKDFAYSFNDILNM